MSDKEATILTAVDELSHPGQIWVKNKSEFKWIRLTAGREIITLGPGEERWLKHGAWFGKVVYANSP